MALVMAQGVPSSLTMTVPHGAAGVRTARRRMREELLASGTPDAVVDDAILILSELLSNAARHARPLDGSESVRASWSLDDKGELTISVTDGGGPTRPLPATPSVTARGGRGLAIITALARDWGVRTEPLAGPETTNGMTVWAVLPADSGFSDRFAASLALDMDLAAIDEPA